MTQYGRYIRGLPALRWMRSQYQVNYHLKLQNPSKRTVTWWKNQWKPFCVDVIRSDLDIWERGKHVLETSGSEHTWLKTEIKKPIEITWRQPKKRADQIKFYILRSTLPIKSKKQWKHGSWNFNRIIQNLILVYACIYFTCLYLSFGHLRSSCHRSVNL